MRFQEKQVSYTSKNTYSTLHTITAKTKNIWIVFHGIGYLSKYFLRHFDELNEDENYIIAPQAPSKYYLNGQYKHVGASWLTKEQTTQEIANVMSYIDHVIENEDLPANCKIIVFGYSQGVSIAARWVAKRKIQCDHLILYGGGLPRELMPEQFLFLKNKCQVKFLVGNKDEFIQEERLTLEKKRIEELFHGDAHLQIYEGGHELQKKLINTLL
ncbi:MAG: esterase [Eudoraea sp.]|nr:esterase [Eudoraea sp.]